MPHSFILSTVVILAIVSMTGCFRSKHHKERWYQVTLCELLGGITEKTLPDRTRVDCLTDRYAIEVDFASKWAQGVGQSLYYAQLSGRKPAVALIVSTSRSDRRNLARLRRLARRYGIHVIKIPKGK